MSFEYTVKKADIESRIKIPTAKIDKYLWIDNKELLQVSKEVDELSKTLHETIDKLRLENSIHLKMVEQVKILKKQRRSYSPRVKNLRQNIINQLVEKNDWITNEQIQKVTGGAHNTINTNLRQLTDEGVIEVDASHRPSRYHIVVSTKIPEKIPAITNQ